MEFELTVKDTWVDVTDQLGNTMFGFVTFNKNGDVSSYEVVGATFNKARFSKEKVFWKRNKCGQVSKAFYEWEEVARKELYTKFFNLTKEVK